MATKDSLRSRFLSMRSALDRREVDRLSQAITARLMASGLVDRARIVGVYSPVKNEARTEEVFREIRGRGNRACYPRVVEDGIEFVEVVRLEDLLPGSWGILEPKRGEKLSLSQVDAILIPGIAFDEAGYRIGFGKGYYDKALAAYGGCKIGIAYDFQVLRELPRNGDDVRCHWVVTDQRVIQGEVSEGGAHGCSNDIGDSC